jgi:hypothetical protein
MTTRADWEWRERYLNDAAQRVEQKARDAMAEAAHFRQAALWCHVEAQRMDQTKPSAMSSA